MPVPGDLAAAIETNVSELLMAMGRAGGGTQRVEEEITWTVGGSPIGYHNAVVRCAAPDAGRARTLVDEWIAELRDRRLPGSWHHTPSMRPGELADTLLAAGLEDGGEEPAMAADLGVDPAPTAVADHLELRPVEDDEGLDAYRRVLGDGFGEGPKEADWVASIYASIGLGSDAPWRHYIAIHDGEPVCTASLFLTPGVAGIYFVSTRPAFRRRGFGAAMTRHVMVEAAGLGAAVGILGSSPMGQGVYERLGFREVFRYRLFEWGG